MTDIFKFIVHAFYCLLQYTVKDEINITWTEIRYSKGGKVN